MTHLDTTIAPRWTTGGQACRPVDKQVAADEGCAGVHPCFTGGASLRALLGGSCKEVVSWRHPVGPRPGGRPQSAEAGEFVLGAREGSVQLSQGEGAFTSR